MTYRLFKNLFAKKSKLDQRDHEELVAKLCLKIKSNFSSDVTWKYLDDMYEHKTDLDASVCGKATTILSDVDKIAASVGKQTTFLSPKLLMTLFDVIYILRWEQQCQIADASGFYKWFLKQDAYFTERSKTVTEEEQEEKSYTWWLGRYQNSPTYNKVRYVFGEALQLELERLLDENIIKRSRTSKDSFTFEDKKVLYTLQNAKDRFDADIPVLDLYMGKYETDHMKSVDDGGETTLENGELMKTSDNRSKGSDSNGPHFPHQLPLC